MEQKDLEKLALWYATKRLAGGSVKGQDDRLRKTLQEAREAKERLLKKNASQEYKLTTVGGVVQERVRLEKLEKVRLDYIKRTRGVDDVDVSRNSEGRENEDATLKRGRVLKLSERITSYRLAGISCFSVGGRPNDLGLRFDATWGGHYFDEKYYVILTGSSLAVHRHSLPYFIPVNDLAIAFLPFDPSQFCRRISRYVSAFAGRRVLAEQLSRDFLGKGKIETSESMDVITLEGRFRGKDDLPIHSVQLVFDNVLALIPHRANVFMVQSNGEMTVHKLNLDRSPLVGPDSQQAFNYTLWITTILKTSFRRGNDEIDDPTSPRSDASEGQSDHDDAT